MSRRVCSPGRAGGAVLLAGVLSLSLVTGAHSQNVTWREVGDDVDVEVLGNCFHVLQRWEVKGATMDELLLATHHLTLSGRHGVYGDRKLLKTDIPEELQNHGAGVNAWAHPTFVPSALGSRARTVPTDRGFRASMSEGILGRGASEVTFQQVAPLLVVVTERGTYSMSRLRTGVPLMDIVYTVGSATFGRFPLAMAHQAMGRLHNKVFNGAEPLVNWVNDNRR